MNSSRDTSSQAIRCPQDRGNIKLVNLRWSNVDFGGKTITIAGSAGVVDGERIEGTTKSGRIRVVSIDDETVAVLREHQARQEADKAAAGEEWSGPKDLHVFTTGFGRPIYPDTVTQLIRDLVKAHNAAQPSAERLPFARLHDLRHVHATTLLLAGVPVHVVAARLGHADPAITLRVYAHVIRSAEASAADVFVQALKGAP
ncbi:tyrosine-type recombinase/integrase [Sphaerisporangium rhizosphaerae]|uniref:Tyrosine-type recombinase/integrase n=1 Tax=Sphaerisporangium rhizosphaerae TaxID=2269375 RepID=A0ABW2P6K2_9ACTN